MFEFLPSNKNKRKQISTPINENQPAAQAPKTELSDEYQEILAYLKHAFRKDDTFIFREIKGTVNTPLQVCVLYCDGLTDVSIMDQYLMLPLTEAKLLPTEAGEAEQFFWDIFPMSSMKKTMIYQEMIDGVTSGDTIVLVDGMKGALLLETKNLTARAVTEPEGEKILSGPREGFTEILLQNLAMVRRKIHSEDLKMQYYTLGTRTRTRICIAYYDGLAKPEVVAEIYRRLARIQIDGILDANYVNEWIRDQPKSPFRSIGYTERPDIVAAKLLEGRVAIFVDGTPVVLTAPYLFIENFQSNEDYYLNYYFTSFTRCLRILGFFLTTLLPGLYITVVAFHQEMLQFSLLISIAAERAEVPLPASLEAIIMLTAFEILRETALRMQVNIGQALSVVGALVIGQAAVSAKFIAAPMLIVIGLSGITSLLVPKMNAPVLIIRFGVLVCSSFFGFLGLGVSCAVLLIHILSLYSFGVWQFSPDYPLAYQNTQDGAFRTPWPRMIFRPSRCSANEYRQPPQGEKK